MRPLFRLRHPELVEGSVLTGWKSRALLVTALILFTLAPSHATTLWPELKAYDFCRAYYLEDGGITLQPQDGFYGPEGTQTPKGLHFKPGQWFIQLDPARMVMEVYTFLRIDPDEHRGYFHEKRYRYKVVRTPDNKQRIVPLDYINSDDFYLTHWRALEWFDGAFPDIEIHPGEELRRTRS
jgi:hypothetical protein